MRVCLPLAVVFCIAASARADGGPRAIDLATRLHSRQGDGALRALVLRMERDRAAGRADDDVFSRVTRKAMPPHPSRARTMRWSFETTPLQQVLELRRLVYRVGAVIAQSTDATGRVDLEAVRARHGATVADFLAELRRTPDPGPNALAHLGAAAAPRLLDRLAETGQLDRARMPALEALVRRHRAARPFAGFEVVALQHLLGTTAGLLQAFVDSGSAADGIHVIGKSYSEHPLVAHQLRYTGAHVLMAHERHLAGKHAPGWLLDLFYAMESGYAPHTDKAEAAFVARLSAPGKRILLVDDGGELILWANGILQRHPELRGRVVAVEQTRRGVRLLRGLELLMPVIAVGDAWAKLEYEAPMIGRSVANEVHAHLEHLRRRGVWPGARVVLFGYGVVGRATARALQRLGYRVEAWDKAWADDPSLRAQALADGVFPHRSRAGALRRASILVAATGERSVHAEDFAELPQAAVVFNAASPGEIDERPMIASAPHSTFLGGPLARIQPDVRAGRKFSVVHAGGRDILVAARGDVINFGAIDPIPARYIQLTRGLLYLGALQAAGTQEPGLHALASRPQRRLVRAVRTQLARSGESLADPTF